MNKYFNWTSDQATTLEIIFSNNSNEMPNANLSPKIKEFKQCSHKWSRWKLSLLRKITILKSFAVPKLIYSLTVLYNLDQVCINKIKKSLCSNFFGKQKTDNFSRDMISYNYCLGGLKMLDLDKCIQSLQCSWVKRLQFQPYSIWVQLYENMLNKYGKQFILKSNIKPKETEKLDTKSKYLNDVLTTWSYVNFKEDITNFGK